MKRKLLFFDIDGTLIKGPNEAPTHKVTEAIREARKNGHLVFLSTGKSEAMVDYAVTEIGFDGGIYSAGGKVRLGDQKIADYPLREEKLKTILDVFSQNKDVVYLLEGDKENFKGNLPKEAKLVDSIEGELSTELQRMLSLVSKIGQRDVSEYKNTPVYKISFFSVKRDAFYGICKELSAIGKVVTFENMAGNEGVFSGEVGDWAIDKGKAIGAVCKYLGEEVADTIAFGDSANDLEMIMAAGLGIAMGNAESLLKDKADLICESVKEDGIFWELKRQSLSD